jgi:hypothetical protein
MAARLDPGLSLIDSECELKYIVGDLARHALLSIGSNCRGPRRGTLPQGAVGPL